MVAADTVLFLVSVIVLYFFYRSFLKPSYSINNQPNTSTSPSRRSQNASRRHYITTQQIEHVAEMFPHVPRYLIEMDLGRTGSVELTCENILSGALVIPATEPPLSSQPTTITTTSNTKSIPFSSSDTFKNLQQDFSSDNIPSTETLKKWEADPSVREANLRNRKQLMLLQARQKYIEKKTAQ